MFNGADGVETERVVCDAIAELWQRKTLDSNNPPEAVFDENSGGCTISNFVDPYCDWKTGKGLKSAQAKPKGMRLYLTTKADATEVDLFYSRIFKDRYNRRKFATMKKSSVTGLLCNNEKPRNGNISLQPALIVYHDEDVTNKMHTVNEGNMNSCTFHGRPRYVCESKAKALSHSGEESIEFFDELEPTEIEKRILEKYASYSTYKDENGDDTSSAATCSLHTDCHGWGWGSRHKACCGGQCVNKLEDHAGLGYCPDECVGELWPNKDTDSIFGNIVKGLVGDLGPNGTCDRIGWHPEYGLNKDYTKEDLQLWEV